MWHIPLSLGERKLLYGADTFDQFEDLLRLVDSLENEENEEYWDILATELGLSDMSETSTDAGEYEDKWDDEEKCEDDFSTTAKEEQGAPVEAIETMEITTHSSIGKEASLEIEQDMRIFYRVQKPGKLSAQDFVEQIAAQYPQDEAKHFYMRRV